MRLTTTTLSPEDRLLLADSINALLDAQYEDREHTLAEVLALAIANRGELGIQRAMDVLKDELAARN